MLSGNQYMVVQTRPVSFSVCTYINGEYRQLSERNLPEKKVWYHRKLMGFE